MKTNVVMKSADRNLFGITIRQRTENSFLSISDLQKAYEVARWQHGWTTQSISQLMQSVRFSERLFHLLNERGLVKVDFPTFMEMVDREGVTNVMKGLGVWKTTGKGVDRAVFSDPYIWVMVALELNPLLYAKVIMWLTDTLIFDRIEAGSEFKPMNSAISKIVPSPDYRKYAIAINEKVFGHHQSGMRNIASAKELSKIARIEQFVSNAIDMKLVGKDEDIINVIKNCNF